jgi:hypothetical protein
MRPFFLAGAIVSLSAGAAWAQPHSEEVQRAIDRAVAQAAPLEIDDRYDTAVARPAYRAGHPRVLFDEAHRNFHTPATRYKPFADLIRNDGYRIETNGQPFTAAALAGHDILVIANAAGAEGPEAYAAAAFTEEECRVVADWVRGGGALLLIADHAPFGVAAESLARMFGVEMSKGVTTDAGRADPESGNRTFILFDRERGGLGGHPIIEGRDASERIGRVMSFSGQSLRGPEGSSALLVLGEGAVDRPSANPAEIRAAVAAAQEQARREGRAAPGAVALRSPGAGIPAAGRAQAIALSFGRGRVVILGEAAMLSAQRMTTGAPIGMNRPGLDNRQFALNLMHWLSGLIG